MRPAYNLSIWRISAALVLICCIPACHHNSDDEGEAYGEVSEEFDESEARQDAMYELDDESFEDIGDTSLCTIDCSGHDAGFEWARDNEITDSFDCGGNSQSFIEGCEAYAEAVEERLDEIQSDYE